MRETELNDKIFDEMIRFAAKGDLDDLCSRLPSEDDLNAGPFPPSLESGMTRFFRSVRRRHVCRRVAKGALRVAAALFIFLAVSGILVFSVKALRIPFLNLFERTDKESTTIRIDEGTVDYRQFAEKIEGLYLPSYMPDGYIVKTLETSNMFYFVTFSGDGDAAINLRSLPKGSSIGVDSEDTKAENITVNGASAQYYANEGEQKLIFKYKENVYLLTGPVSKQELIQIAQSMKPYD